MVEDLNPLVEELKKDPQIILFAMLKMDDFTDRWSIVVGGEKLEEIKDRKTLFESIGKIIEDNPDSLKKHDIARIGIFPLGNHLIQDLMKHAENSEFENEKANGNYIHKGHILINKNVVAE